jgi:hypothetical protein
METPNQASEPVVKTPSVQGEGLAGASCSALINAYERYIALLVDELNEVVPLAMSHGWKTSRAQSGEAARTEIQKVKDALSEPNIEKCQRWMMNHKSSWPRTCPTCGLFGKCRFDEPNRKMNEPGSSI